MDNDLPDFDDVLRIVRDDIQRNCVGDKPILDVLAEKAESKLLVRLPFVDPELIRKSARRAANLYIQSMPYGPRLKYKDAVFDAVQECIDSAPITVVDIVAFELVVNSFHYLFIQPFFDAFNKANRSAKARRAGRGRDLPKKLDKARVLQYWERWQSEPSLYKSQEEFSLDMLEKFGINAGGTLTSTDTIKKKWIPEFRSRETKGN